VKPTQIKSKSPRRAEASIDHFFCFACDEYVWDRDHLIEERIAFGTNDIAPAGQIIPKHAWVSGVVRMEPNKTHSITPGNPLPFHSLLDVGAVIEKALIEHGVMLHQTKRMKKYMASD